MTQLKDVIHLCSTASVRSLSLEIIDELNLIVPNTLVSFANLNVDIQGDHINPFLQLKAKNSLAIALQKRGQRLIVNSAYRTVAQQYLLRRQYELGLCGIPAAAPPSLSNHESGLALDIEDPDGWEPYFEQHGFLRLGAFDPPHYDYNLLSGIRQDLNTLGVLAFQRLWNKHNPNLRISEDSIFGSSTAKALEKSPIEGFGAQELLRRGSQGEAVWALQTQLKEKFGFDLEINGFFGIRTESAIKELQLKAGLSPDGVVGAATSKLLQQNFASQRR